MGHYGSMSNYLLYLIPNMLSYVFEFEIWQNKIAELEEEQD